MQQPGCDIAGRPVRAVLSLLRQQQTRPAAASRCGACAGCGDAAQPRVQPAEAWQRVARLHDLPDGGKAQRFLVHKRPISVWRRGARVYALRSRCPHAGVDLTRGPVDLEAGTVRCPGHGVRFSIIDGSCASEPVLRAVVHATRVDHGTGDVFIGGPVAVPERSKL